MRGVFNILGRALSTLIGLLLLFMGSVWILQGLDIAFQGDSFMAGDPQWAVYGAIAVLLGILQVAWSNTRQR
jgi:hypothetical protein